MTTALRRGREADQPDTGMLLDRPVRLPYPGVRDEVADRAAVHAREDLAAHRGRWGARPGAAGSQGQALVATLADIGLTGRGGGHFPAARKWQAVRAAGGGGTVVANAAEGEPASGKDAVLLARRPHLVLDGLVSAAEAVGATDLVIWLHEGDQGGLQTLRHALRERAAARLREPAIRVALGPDTYLAGESSAILQSLEGGPALPRFRRTPTAQDGLRGRPALVHNVETLARVAAVSRLGAQDYVPTTLLTVVGSRDRTVLEVGPASTLGEALAAAGADEPAAVLVGGYGGSWLDAGTAGRLPVHEPAARAAGGSLGAGVLVPLPPGGCGLAHTAAILDYLADSGARQCGPCLFGLPALAHSMSLLAQGRAGRKEVGRLERIAEQVSGRGGCHHPDGAVRLARSALSVFADDVARHQRGRPCPGGAAEIRLPGVTR